MDLFKLLGTVAVDVKDALEAFKKVKDEGDKTEGKLGKVFSGIGKGAAVAGKAIGTGLLAGAGAVAALSTAAIKSYADYEQLVGGVETLFGTRGAKSVQEYADLVGKSVSEVEAEFGMLQQAQSDVMKNAANAYKDAGMSANEYMETVNGFAAALNQSSASQLESAELANQAVIDMSDNANKMGTDIEAIKTAYAGFSKQNFTMLDNLKLGYGGTKTEMERLLKDAEKISGIKYDISSFADITSAIHVMQEEMGIAGTTANEASTTIQGSLGMLKGAWSNLLTGLSDPEADIGALIDNVFSSVVTFGQNLIPRVTQVLTGVATAFQQLVPLLAGELPNMLMQVLPALIQGAAALVEALVAALPGVLDAIMGMLPALIEGIMSIVDALIGALPQILQTLLAALPTLIPQLIDGIVSMIMMLVEMLPQIIQPIIDNLPTIIVAIVEALTMNLPILIQGAIQLVVALCAALPQIVGALWDALMGIFASWGSMIGNLFEPIKNALSNAWEAMGNVPGLSSMKTMIENIWGAIKNYITTYINAIKNVVTTVWNSIKNVISTVINAIKNVISTAWNAIKTIISSVMKLISSILKGDWEGVKSAISSILNAIKSVIQSIWNGIKSVISSVLNGIKNTISSIWNGIVSVLSSYLNMIKTTITSVWNGIKGAISGAVTGIKTTVTKGFNDVKNKVINAFKNLPQNLKTIGKNLVEGLWNGIKNAKDWVLGKIKGFGESVLKGIKKIFGINSPSKETEYDGAMLAEGLAVGIKKKKSKAEEAADELANATLEAAEKRLDEFKTYNELSLEEEVKYWDAARVQIKEGTDARLEADKKYLAAKKAVDEKYLEQKKAVDKEVKKINESVMKENEKFIDAEKELQSELDAINQSIKDRQSSILNTFSLFEKFTGGNSNPISRFDLAGNLQSQIKSLEMWDDELSKLEAKIGGTGLFAEISAMGVEALSQVQEINKMTGESLKEYVDLYNRRTELAGNQANREMQDEANTRTQEAWQKFAEKCAEIGANVGEIVTGMKDVSVEAFNGISEGAGNIATKIDETLAKMKAAFESFKPQMKMPHFTISGSFDIESGSVPSVSVEWYKKAMNNAMLLKEPTIFGYDQTSGKYLGGGEAGSEVVAGSSTLMTMIKGAVAEQNSTITYYMQKLIQMLSAYFPQLIDALDVDIFLDSGVLVGELAVPMNNALGKLTSRKDRGR
jgi:phage-related protein